jgi:acetoin utilization deacetylase AcuC-like enzyme
VKRRRSSNVACSPTSGFHHAGWNHAEGFCTFNGLMVAALQMLAEGRAIKVGILDCDFHEGNGTQDILDRMTDAGALLCNDTIVHRSIGSEHLQTARGFRGWLNRALDDMAGCDLVLYQAGADMHKDDPLGGLLDTVGMAERDATVFKHQAQYGYGLVWNLAGGYARDEAGDIGPVLYLHLLTLEACLRVAEVA